MMVPTRQFAVQFELTIFLEASQNIKLKSRFLMKTAVFNMFVFNASEPAERT